MFLIVMGGENTQLVAELALPARLPEAEELECAVAPPLDPLQLVAERARPASQALVAHLVAAGAPPGSPQAPNHDMGY